MNFHSNTDNFTSVLNLTGVMAVPGYVGSISQIWNTTGVFLQWSNDTFASFFLAKSVNHSVQACISAYPDRHMKVLM